jgi:hypothetical protein
MNQAMDPKSNAPSTSSQFSPFSLFCKLKGGWPGDINTVVTAELSWWDFCHQTIKQGNWWRMCETDKYDYVMSYLVVELVLLGKSGEQIFSYLREYRKNHQRPLTALNMVAWLEKRGAGIMDLIDNIDLKSINSPTKTRLGS